MKFITDYILTNPPVLMALIALIGLLVQKKSFSDIIKGSLTAAFGMVILTSGVNILSGIISVINSAFQSEMGIEMTEGLSDVTFTNDYGGVVGISMFLGLIIHLLIARFTPIKTIFLTGHMLWWFPFVIVAGGVEAGLSRWTLIILAAVLSGVYWSVMPWLMRNYIWDATGDESFLIGHPTGILSLLSGFVAKHVGNKDVSTENIKVPESLSFFKEISISGGIVLFVVYFVIGLFIPSFVPEGGNLLMFSLDAGIKFGAGLLIMLYGVRLLINQIIPAFQGIAEKIVPGAIPAFDVPILFNYRPNAVIIGFIIAMITSTVLIVVANTFNLFNVVLVPLVITSFFECGGAAVVGEAEGGLRGCVIGTVSASVLMVILVGISGAMTDSTIQNWMLIFGGNDLSLMEMISQWIGNIIGGI